MIFDPQPTSFPWGRLALALLLALALRLPSLNLPLDRDEGEYATLALSHSRGAGLVYRDYLEQKAPGTVAAYSIFFMLGGQRLEAIRLGSLLWQLLSLAALFLLALEFFVDANVAFVASLLYAVLSASPRLQGLTANTESFVSLPMLAAMALCWNDRDRNSWLATGALIGLAGLFKQSALPAALIVPALLSEGDLRQRARDTAICLAGTAAVWISVLLFFVVLGAGGSFLNCVIGYNLSYASQGLSSQARNLLGVLIAILSEQTTLGLALALALWAAFRGRLEGVKPLLAWLLSMALGCTLSGRYYPHYFLTLMAPVALLLALWALQQGSRWGRAGRIACFAVFGLSYGASAMPLWEAADGQARSKAQYGIENFAVAPIAAEAIASRSPEGSRILIWGSEAEVYFESGRLPASRFLFHYPFSGEAPRWPGGEEEYLAALEAPGTAALLQAADLSYSDPFQRRLMTSLKNNYSARVDLAPPFIIWLRKR